MIFEKTATTVSLHATRQLSRRRPLTILLLNATIAIAITFVSYKVTFSMVLFPLASLSFQLLHRVPSYPPVPAPPALPSLPRAPGALPHPTAHVAQRALLNYASLPMRRPEADLMLSYLSPADVYLEYGASGTTLAVPPLVATAFSVEHDVQVCKGIDAEMHYHPRLADTLRAFCVPVAAGHAGWGTLSPFEEGSYAAFQNYVDLPRSNLSDHRFDKVLINGHARVACALRILPQLKPTSLVFFHDFFLRPAHYAAVLPFYHEVARVVAHSSVTGFTDEPMGMLVLRPREQYVTSDADVAVSRINTIYAQYEEEQPSEASTNMQIAYDHGLLPSDGGAFPLLSLKRQLARQSTQARLFLDLVAIPFVILTYMVLRDVFRKVFLKALSASSPRGHRLLTGDLLAATSWANASTGAVLAVHAKSSSLPVTSARTAATSCASGKAE
ncbi:unnamed protein product [Agarophyton chilense]|eukprot:gb/GEZJ01004967.1/.p1 GENE.gb/GEZJ01004967.1/~~gb/GEZJ01004967.1/.p1  ORF type:complete len:443 (+),score=64.18 gb/GEZJ01004967.1/:87-1415(+)